MTRGSSRRAIILLGLLIGALAMPREAQAFDFSANFNFNTNNWRVAAAVAGGALVCGGLAAWFFSGPSDEQLLQDAQSAYDEYFRSYDRYVGYVETYGRTFGVDENCLHALAEQSGVTPSFISSLYSSASQLDKTYAFLRKRMMKIKHKKPELYAQMGLLVERIDAFRPRLEVLSSYLTRHSRYFKAYQMVRTLRDSYYEECSRVATLTGKDLADSLHARIVRRGNQRHDDYYHVTYVKNLAYDIHELEEAAASVAPDYAAMLDNVHTLLLALTRTHDTVVADARYMQVKSDYQRECREAERHEETMREEQKKRRLLEKQVDAQRAAAGAQAVAAGAAVATAAELARANNLKEEAMRRKAANHSRGNVPPTYDDAMNGHTPEDGLPSYRDATR